MHPRQAAPAIGFFIARIARRHGDEPTIPEHAPSYPTPPAAPADRYLMSLEHLTLADLRKAGTITSPEIVAAIDAYMLDPTAGPYRFASGHSLDIATVVSTSSDVAR